MAVDKIYCGVDVGASATKVAVIGHDGVLRGFRVKRSGAEGPRVARESMDAILGELKMNGSDVGATVATGYARDSVDFADFTRTEIACHGKGVLREFPGPITIIDIGGQDNKIITLDANGKRVSFKFNRKCAAGTGAFIEEIAELLEIPIDKLNSVAEESDAPVKLGSFCTVFTKTEILTNFKKGDRIADIAAGAFESVVTRVVEMDPLNGDIVITGGVVAHNPIVRSIFERVLGKPVKVPEHPQLTGAIGAALIAFEENGNK